MRAESRKCYSTWSISPWKSDIDRSISVLLLITILFTKAMTSKAEVKVDTESLSHIKIVVIFLKLNCTEQYLYHNRVEVWPRKQSCSGAILP